MSRMKKQRRRSSARVVRAELARALAIFEHAVGPTREAVPAFRTLDAAIDRVAVHERQLTLRAEQLGGGACGRDVISVKSRFILFPIGRCSRADREPTFRRFGGPEWDQFEFARPSVCGQLQAAYGAPIHEAGKGRGVTGGAAGNRGAARGTLPRHRNPPSLSAVPSGLCGSGCARLHSSRSDAGLLRMPPLGWGQEHAEDAEAEDEAEGALE